MPRKICRTLRRNDGSNYTTCFTPSGQIRGRAANLRRVVRGGGRRQSESRPPLYSRGGLPEYSLGSPPKYTPGGSPPSYKQYLKDMASNR